MHSGPEDIAHAVSLLKQGRLVAFPTETVYGLGADALNAGAVDAVFRAKGRPATNPLIVHVVDEAMARRVSSQWPRAASVLAERFWPGPLTLVLPRAPAVPDAVAAGGATVAVRCPDHPLTLALIETLGAPLVGPSANRSGGISPTCAEHVRESFSEAEVFVLDGGPCVGGIESTVVDLTTDPPRVLRPGLITSDQIAAALGTPVEANNPGPAEQIARSPGQHRSHYAPATPLRLVAPAGLTQALGAEEGAAVVLGPADILVSNPHTSIEMPHAPAAYAARLYAALREADAQRLPRILVVQPWGDSPPTAAWEAVADRLRRAAAPREG
ncbi:MAG: threonylcarbamoyl-AMP synthase [Phycisphaerales bacterium]|nr:threonylcarbamoyl-AMP synthase [Phycisphaerales bacterium]